jgi:N6-adenosine-specific RNA methylase IME4
VTLPALPSPGAAISAEQVAGWERHVAEHVADVPDVETAQEWRAQAAALEAYLRSKGLHGPMLGAQRRVEARIGQLLGEARPGPAQSSVVTEVSEKNARHDFRLLGRALRGECEPPLGHEEWRDSRRNLVAVVRRRLGLIETSPLPDGTFRCVVADPPWQLTTGATMPGKFGDIALKDGGDALTYEQMTLEDIAALDVAGLAAPDAHLYLWTVNRYVEAAYDIARSWGFEPSALLTWCKAPMGVGLGGTFRFTTEFVLFCRRGRPAAEEIVPTTWFQWPRGRHSVKPVDFYALAERVSPGPRIDLFARAARDGWSTWGREAPRAIAPAP